MPNTKTQPQKKEKRDFKQEFLEKIVSQYGLTSAMAMEDAIKNQSTQIKDAMLQGGATMPQVAGKMGIDIGMLNGLIKKQSGVSQEEPQQQQVQPQMGQAQSGDVTPMNRLLMALGSGLAAAGGNKDFAGSLLGFIAKQKQNPLELENTTSLIAQRKANTILMEKMAQGQDGGQVQKIYRDPVTGQEVDPEQAEKDMEEGLGIYQVNQILSTRSGIVEKPLNKVPELTQEEKKYVNDARLMNSTLSNLENGFNVLYDKYGKANWQSLQIEKLPYFISQDQSIQNLKSDLIYLKAAIPFLRGGKQLTTTEAKRVDAMLNPFGKNKETYMKDIERFENEFLFGAEIMKFGVNAGLMKKLVKTERKKIEQQNEDTGNNEYEQYLKLIGGQ